MFSLKFFKKTFDVYYCMLIATIKFLKFILIFDLLKSIDIL